MRDVRSETANAALYKFLAGIEIVAKKKSLHCLSGTGFRMNEA
jgi:hypothetical protein